MHSWARIGAPAATLPKMGTWFSIAWTVGTVMARPLQALFSMRPASSSFFRWKWTVEGDLSPTASPISRTEGAYPCSPIMRTMVS